MPAPALLALALRAPGDRITGRACVSRSEVIARHGMACTSQPLATQAALAILQKGGSAVDAAIAANAVQALIEPVSCGLGGDCFAIVWDEKAHKLAGYNGSGRSPAALTLEEFQKRGLKHVPQTGPLPVSVPGCVDAWFALHERFGKLPMAEVLAPAIGYAREGAPIEGLVAYYWERNARALSKFPHFSDVFLPGGKAPATGESFANPELAHSLELLAKLGRDAFYKGEIAVAIDKYMKQNGGFLAYADLAAHQGEWVEPISVDYRGYEVWELPPNGQGIAVLQMLRLLAGYDVRALGWARAQWVHLFVEAKKLAFEDRP